MDGYSPGNRAGHSRGLRRGRRYAHDGTHGHLYPSHGNCYRSGRGSSHGNC